MLPYHPMVRGLCAMIPHQFYGTFQIPVDSSQETSGGDRIVILERILKIHHHPPPTRGHTMKFTRRPDLAPQTRIDIVMLAWLHQGVYGKMTEIAQCYQISRTFLYQLLFLANLQLETLFSDEKRLFQKDHCHLEAVRKVKSNKSES